MLCVNDWVHVNSLDLFLSCIIASFTYTHIKEVVSLLLHFKESLEVNKWCRDSAIYSTVALIVSTWFNVKYNIAEKAHISSFPLLESYPYLSLWVGVFSMWHQIACEWVCVYGFWISAAGIVSVQQQWCDLNIEITLHAASDSGSYSAALASSPHCTCAAQFCLVLHIVPQPRASITLLSTAPGFSSAEEKRDLLFWGHVTGSLVLPVQPMERLIQL